MLNIATNDGLECFVQPFSQAAGAVLHSGPSTPDIDLINGLEHSINILKDGLNILSLNSLELYEDIANRFNEMRFISREVCGGLFAKYFPGGEKFEMPTLTILFMDMSSVLEKHLEGRNLTRLIEHLNANSGFAALIQGRPGG
ncbi:hypothetical protein Trichorick_01143 [Candidatus Trichorickettsia mobilis]|uniref:Uncharacterized protein n=1 Tax=Candidatus Trichorickettsia mobilis TaxID=1346319 RepID=A0ABZ0UT66_9RICK|nr:hypothetical protein [Candidatus Trichorickettsia mobilis]WPY01235.1 hypothetical protein Trichorick_01143 [Candidatus Trichorickettsia mobilis]